MATWAGLAAESAMTRTSEGPAGMSIDTMASLVWREREREERERRRRERERGEREREERERERRGGERERERGGEGEREQGSKNKDTQSDLPETNTHTASLQGLLCQKEQQGINNSKSYPQ